jgi:hypothetical protein
LAPVAERELSPQVTPPGAFNVTGWGRDHYYGATFENTFAHNKALLHSTKYSVGKATGSMQIPRAATYYVGVRYEAAYLFETEFTLTVSQGGPKFTKIYGQRASLAVVDVKAILTSPSCIFH